MRRKFTVGLGQSIDGYVWWPVITHAGPCGCGEIHDMTGTAAFFFEEMDTQEYADFKNAQHPPITTEEETLQ